MDHIGIDVHQRYSQVCEMVDGQVVMTARVATTTAGLRRQFGGRERARIVLECGGSSRWVARLLQELGHQVVVVNPRRVRLIAESTLKTDRIDAEILARLAGMDPELVEGVYQRREPAERVRTILGVRQTLIRSHTAMINAVRGRLRSLGHRMPSSGSRRFVARFYEQRFPVEVEESLEPLLEMIARLDERLAAVEAQIREHARRDALLRRLQEVPGVGPVVSSAFEAWIDDPHRFQRSRDVGAYVGLRPRVRNSGERECHGKITRAGDVEMRRLLVQAAQTLLNAREDCALKRWGLALAARCGRNKAAIAVARKLAIVLHRMWVREESFHPFPQAA
jgi:transposase